MQILIGYAVHATQPQPNGQWTFMFIKGTQARLLQPSHPASHTCGPSGYQSLQLARGETKLL
jgi:hypothetical protein